MSSLYKKTEYYSTCNTCEIGSQRLLKRLTVELGHITI